MEPPKQPPGPHFPHTPSVTKTAHRPAGSTQRTKKPLTPAGPLPRGTSNQPLSSEAGWDPPQAQADPGQPRLPALHLPSAALPVTSLKSPAGGRCGCQVVRNHHLLSPQNLTVGGRALPAERQSDLSAHCLSTKSSQDLFREGDRQGVTPSPGRGPARARGGRGGSCGTQDTPPYFSSPTLPLPLLAPGQ